MTKMVNNTGEAGGMVKVNFDVRFFTLSLSLVYATDLLASSGNRKCRKKLTNELFGSFKERT